MNVLLVDDHPMTLDGYVLALSKVPSRFSLPFFDKALSCEKAYYLIKNANNKFTYDIAILDMDLPSCIAPPIASGKDLALIIRDIMPTTKIIMITAHTELITIYDIWKSVKPEGFVIKNDLTPEGLLNIVEVVSGGEVYKSYLVEECIREIWKKEIIIEDYNRQIIYYLSLGFKLKDLHKMIPISRGAINKRMIKINSVFEVTDKEGLLKEVKRLGYI